MNATELREGELSELEEFKNREYPALDKAHYGDKLPNFIRTEHTFVVRYESEIAGYLKMGTNTGVGKIWSILVGEAFRRKRVGTTLIEAAEAKAKTLGVHKMRIEVGADWEVKPFYERMGYTVRATLPNDIGHLDCVLMDKVLE